MVKVKVTGLNNIEGLTKDLENLKLNVPKLISDFGWRAYELAPMRTGALREAIHWFSTEKKGTIEVLTPNNKDNRNRPYHLWQHGIGKYNLSKGKYSPKTGKADFMRVVENEINKTIDQEIKTKLAKL